MILETREDLRAALHALGFHDDAADLGNAATPADERRAIEAARHAIEGAQVMLRRHWRALQGHTAVRVEAAQLAELDEALLARLAVLSATAHTEVAA